MLPVLRAIVRTSPPGRLKWLAWRLGHSRLVTSVDFITEANGIIVAGNTQDLIQGYLYWFGVWEPNLTDFIVRRMSIAPHRTFVDVGANIGYFTTLVAKHYPLVKVVSIEAFPPTIEKLRVNLELNSVNNVRVIEAAVSDGQGVLELFYGGRFNEGATTTVKGRFNTAAHTVACKPLPELLTDGEIAAMRLAKIDVEGAELSVIKGLAPALALMPKDVEVIVEISGNSKENSKIIFDTFAEYNFNAYEIENDYSPLAYLRSGVPRKPKRLSTIPSKQTDVVFSRLDTDWL